MMPNETVKRSAPPSDLPPLPAKTFFTVAEVLTLLDVPEHLLRQWEREFAVGNRRGRPRRTYRREELLLLRRIRRLILDEGRPFAEVRAELLLTVTLEEAFEERLRTFLTELATVEAELAALRERIGKVVGETPAPLA
ncbi:hypothetical protein JCM16106_16820 [Hydrogenophilus islandicus]